MAQSATNPAKSRSLPSKHRLALRWLAKLIGDEQPSDFLRFRPSVVNRLMMRACLALGLICIVGLAASQKTTFSREMWSAIAPGIGFLPRSALPYLSQVYLVVALLIAPWVDGAFMVRRFSWRRLVSLKRLKSAAFFLLAEGSVIGVLALGFHRSANKIMLVGLGVIGSLLVLGFLFLSVRSIWLSCSDFRRLKRTTVTSALSRSEIGADFRGLRTSWARSRYVDWLDNSQIQPIGDWDGGRPNIRDDTASTKLAQLDERWLAIEL
jgi:hypothetical protein